MLAMTGWSTTLFAVLVPLGTFMLGGLLQVVYRLGRLNQKLDTLKDVVDDLWTVHLGDVRRQREHGE